MNQQPDKIFRDKLQSFQAPAPSGAWNRIESNLSKKKEKVLWLRIAASLLLLAVAAYVLWPSTGTDIPTPAIADKTKTQEKVLPHADQEEREIPQTLPKANELAKKEIRTVERDSKKQKQNATKIDQSQGPSEQTNAVAVVEEPQNQNVIIEQEQREAIAPSIERENPVAVASASPEKLKIVFSSEEIDEKYLNKKAVADATADDKKQSTLKKLLDKAYDLKYNQDPFGDLRQKKDEILALNFRKDKRSDN